MSRCTEKTCNNRRCKNAVYTLGLCVSHCVCAICHDKLNTSKPTIMRCGHAFHDACIKENKKYNLNCPTCRAIIFKPKITLMWCIDSSTHSAQVRQLLLERYENNTLPSSLRFQVVEGPQLIDLEDT